MARDGCAGERKVLNILFQGWLSCIPTSHSPSLLPSHCPHRDLSLTRGWSCTHQALKLHWESHSRGDEGEGGGQGKGTAKFIILGFVGLDFFFCCCSFCRWQSTCKSLPWVHYWGFYSLMNPTHLRNRIVFHCSRCSVQHLWLTSSYLNISCKHQKLFVCFNVPSHPITQWRWKIEMQRCLAKRIFFPPSFLPLLPLMYPCLVSN